MYIISELLRDMAEENLTQLTLMPGFPPLFHRNGKPVDDSRWKWELTRDECESLVLSILAADHRETLSAKGAVETTISLNFLPASIEYKIQAKIEAGFIAATIFMLGRKQH